MKKGFVLIITALVFTGLIFGSACLPLIPIWPRNHTFKKSRKEANCASVSNPVTSRLR